MPKLPSLLLVLALTPGVAPQCGHGPSVPPSETTPTQAAPGQVTVTNLNERTVGNIKMYSSTQLSVAWTAPAGTVDHYEVAVIDATTGISTRVTTTSATAGLSALKAATTYSVVVTACGDVPCTKAGA